MESSGYSPTKINPVGSLSPIIRALKVDIRYLGESNLTAELQALGKLFSHINKVVPERNLISSGSPIYWFSLHLRLEKRTLQPM